MDKQKSLDVQIKRGARDGQWIMGHVGLDRDHDTISPKAFTDALKLAGNKLVALWQHKHDQPIGKWENLKYEDGSLIGDLKIAGTNLGKMVKQLLSDDVPLGASIGFLPTDWEPNDHGGAHIKQMTLLETSVVSVPANPRAVMIAKHFFPDEEVDILIDKSAPDASEVIEQKPGVSATGLHDEAIRKAKLAVLAANQLLRTKK